MFCLQSPVSVWLVQSQLMTTTNKQEPKPMRIQNLGKTKQGINISLFPSSASSYVNVLTNKLNGCQTL